METQPKKQNHTPTPWELGERGILNSTRDVYIAQTAFESPDAEFIVRACNSHYELLEACKRALPLLRIGNKNNMFAFCADQLEQAIAKAEGKQTTI